jgi:hypothetical protein
MNELDILVSNVVLYTQETYSIQIPDEKHPLDIKKIKKASIIVRAHTKKDMKTGLLTLEIYQIGCGNYKLATRARITNVVIEEMQKRFNNFTVTLCASLESQRLGLSFSEYISRFPMHVPGIASIVKAEES